MCVLERRRSAAGALRGAPSTGCARDSGGADADGGREGGSASLWRASGRCPPGSGAVQGPRRRVSAFQASAAARRRDSVARMRQGAVAPGVLAGNTGLGAGCGRAGAVAAGRGCEGDRVVCPHQPGAHPAGEGQRRSLAAAIPPGCVAVPRGKPSGTTAGNAPPSARGKAACRGLPGLAPVRSLPVREPRAWVLSWYSGQPAPPGAWPYSEARADLG